MGNINGKDDDRWTKNCETKSKATNVIGIILLTCVDAIHSKSYLGVWYTGWRHAYPLHLTHSALHLPSTHVQCLLTNYIWQMTMTNFIHKTIHKVTYQLNKALQRNSIEPAPLWLLVDHCVLRNWDRILVRAVKGLISRAGMVSICPLLWQRDVKLKTNKRNSIDIMSVNIMNQKTTVNNVRNMILIEVGFSCIN